MRGAAAVLLLAVLGHVTPWTIDLPGDRRSYFEKEQHDKTKHDVSKDDVSKRDDEKLFFDNIEPDSEHNRHEVSLHHNDDNDNDYDNDVYDGNAHYADDYQYLSYMEKKVQRLVHSGGSYLEGLRRALDRYGDTLRACADRTTGAGAGTSPAGPWLPENERPLPTTGSAAAAPAPPAPPAVPLPSADNQTTTLPFDFTNLNSSMSTAQCANASRESEHVRRLAALALWATRELQDRHYNDNYKGGRGVWEEEEAELVVRLAYFLDRLAHYTGFEPNTARNNTNNNNTASTTTAAPFSALGEVGSDVTRRLAECLDLDDHHNNTNNVNNDNTPATERCRYPLELPDFLKVQFNITDSPDTISTSTERPQTSDTVYGEMMRAGSGRGGRGRRDARGKRGGLFITLLGERLANRLLDREHEHAHEHEHFPEHEHEHEHEYGHVHKRRLLEKLAALKNSYKKLLEFLAVLRHRHHAAAAAALREHEREGGERRKRAAGTLPPPLVEYVKHKLWENSNQHNPGQMDVDNHLPAESPAPQGAGRIHRRSIQNVKYPDLSGLAEHGPGVNYVTDEHELRKFRKYLESGRGVSAPPDGGEGRAKRATYYGRKERPGAGGDPSEDISYYVKAREGTRARASALEAAQLRASLERVFREPDGERVRRFGSSYDPLVPSPLAAGLYRSFFLDI